MVVWHVCATMSILHGVGMDIVVVAYGLAVACVIDLRVCRTLTFRKPTRGPEVLEVHGHMVCTISCICRTSPVDWGDVCPQVGVTQHILERHPVARRDLLTKAGVVPERLGV